MKNTWITYGKTLLTFRNDKLNQPGTLVVIKDKDTGVINQVLIGDVTDKFIVRGTWPKYSTEDIIVRYKKVWIKDVDDKPSIGHLRLQEKDLVHCTECNNFINGGTLYYDKRSANIVYCYTCQNKLMKGTK